MVHETNLLHDVEVSTASTTDADADMVFSHVFLCDSTSLLRESGREHHVDMVIIIVGVTTHDILHVVHPVR